MFELSLSVWGLLDRDEFFAVGGGEWVTMVVDEVALVEVGGDEMCGAVCGNVFSESEASEYASFDSVQSSVVQKLQYRVESVLWIGPELETVGVSLLHDTESHSAALCRDD